MCIKVLFVNINSKTGGKVTTFFAYMQEYISFFVKNVYKCKTHVIF